jgi:hypothetical protein
VVENSVKSELQLTQVKALSGEEALHFEQVCMDKLRRCIEDVSELFEREQPDFTAFYLIMRTLGYQNVLQLQEFGLEFCVVPCNTNN